MPDALRDWGRRALPSLPPLSRRARLGLLVIVAGGALLRVLWALKAQHPVELRDPVLYLILADHVAAGDGYRYGFEAANRYEGRSWNEVESDLSRSWDKYEHRGNSTWEQIKDAVRDAWDRVTGSRTTVGSR